MRVLIGCEESATVRDAFRQREHDAWSCDVLQTRGDPTWHIQADIFTAIHKCGPWDMLIAFPPCTHLCVSGARWWPQKLEAQRDAIGFCRQLMDEGAKIGRFALENPIGILSTAIRKPDQIIQPWQFGHRETKATCLWLHGLRPLVPTDIVGPPVTPEEKREFAKVHRAAPGPNRARDRSKTYHGVADAMAAQWGSL